MKNSALWQSRLHLCRPFIRSVTKRIARKLDRPGEQFQLFGNALDVVADYTDVHTTEAERFKCYHGILGGQGCGNRPHQQALQVRKAIRETLERSASHTTNSGAWRMQA